MTLKKKVQTKRTTTTTAIVTYFIDVDEPDTDCLCYEPSDVEVINIEETEEVIWVIQSILLKMSLINKL